MRWQDIKDDREKYAAYLCSREWSIKKEQVRSRCGGWCEKCYANRMDHVHHLTYARKYNERPVDLQGICRECHDFTHGKTNTNTRSTGVVAYLAGKVSRRSTDFRRELIVSDEIIDQDPRRGEWPVIRNGLRVAYCDLIYIADYCGPYPFGIGGHGIGHGDGTHGCAEATEVNRNLHECEQDREAVALCCFKAIHACSHLFAWIDAPDAYGTILEIGYAVALKKSVSVGIGPNMLDRMDDLWLVGFADTYGHSAYPDAPSFIADAVRRAVRMEARAND